MAWRIWIYQGHERGYVAKDGKVTKYKSRVMRFRTYDGANWFAKGFANAHYQLYDYYPKYKIERTE